MIISRDSQLRNYGSSLWWRVPLIGTILAFPLIGPAALFLAVYGSGAYADFWTLFLESLLVALGSVPIGAVLVAVARAIQRDLFPKHPQVAGFTFAAHCTPARETGGDFYDFIDLECGRVGVVVADVAGKSIPAALLMANARSTWPAAAAGGASPKAVLEWTNRVLCQDVGPWAFVTLFYAIIDPAESSLHFASAGHPPAILRHNSSLRELSANGLPLGLVPSAEYVEARVSLPPGDRIILYTDGIVESLDAQRRMFGFERFYDTLARLSAERPQVLVEEILSAVRDSSGPAEQVDDVTLLVIQAERSL